MKILIVDDELLIRKSLKKVMLQKGHEVFDASNGLEGLKLWRAYQPDLVVLDVLMPEMGGVELLNELRENQPELLKTVIIMISAYSAGGTKEDFIKLGATDFVRKPFETVHKFVDECLQYVGASH